MGPDHGEINPDMKAKGRHMSRQASMQEKEKMRMDLKALLQEKANVAAEKKSLTIEFILDVVDVVVKMSVFLSFSNAMTEETESFWSGLLTLVVLAALLSTTFTSIRVQFLMDLNHVVTYGYSKKWKTKNRIGGGKDMRVQRDAERRQLFQVVSRSMQAFVADLPWIGYNMYRVQTTEADDLLSLLSICFAGVSFGTKFANFLQLIKLIIAGTAKMKRKDVYQVLPADVSCGTGESTNDNTEAAIVEAYEKCKGQLGGRQPSFVFVTMTANHNHEAGLQKLRLIAPGVPYSGCTTCQGVMAATKSVRDNHKVVGIWGIVDPEGAFTPGHFEVGSNPAQDAENALMDAMNRHKMNRDKNNVHLVGKPGFIIVNGSPGPEDEVLKGFGRVEEANCPCIGGSSADNDISASWKQWTSTGGGTITSNGVAFTVCYSSAVVQSQLFTGYNPTGKSGIVTKTAGPRHILEIEGRPAAKVYDEWTGGEFTATLAEKEDSVILGPSSLFPLGQVCGVDDEREPVYRSMHPHLLVKQTTSMTLFSDVYESQQVVLMSGTKDNIVNRIAGVATHIVRESDFTLPELRGALVVFCAGCMMFADDKMDVAAQKLNDSLGNVPYMGIHTFGEQGRFPDGENRHGNLMFSALVVSSKRRITKLLNVDTGRTVLETDAAEYKRIIDSGAVDMS